MYAIRSYYAQRIAENARIVDVLGEGRLLGNALAPAIRHDRGRGEAVRLPPEALGEPLAQLLLELRLRRAAQVPSYNFV